MRQCAKMEFSCCQSSKCSLHYNTGRAVASIVCTWKNILAQSMRKHFYIESTEKRFCIEKHYAHSASNIGHNQRTETYRDEGVKQDQPYFHLNIVGSNFHCLRSYFFLFQVRACVELLHQHFFSFSSEGLCRVVTSTFLFFFQRGPEPSRDIENVSFKAHL
jgi:hypothetical protein